MGQKRLTIKTVPVRGAPNMTAAINSELAKGQERLLDHVRQFGRDADGAEVVVTMTVRLKAKVPAPDSFSTQLFGTCYVSKIPGRPSGMATAVAIIPAEGVPTQLAVLGTGEDAEGQTFLFGNETNAQDQGNG